MTQSEGKEFTEKGIALLFEEELQSMSESVATVKARFEANGMTFEGLGERWKKNATIVRAAFSQDPQSLQFAHRDAVQLLIKEDSTHFQYIHKDLKFDRKFLLAAAKQNAAVVEFFPEEVKGDRNFLLSLVEQVPERAHF